MIERANREPFPDPYDDLTDEELEREILEVLDQSTVKISLRVPKRLLERTKHAANERGVAYQTLIKAILDRGISRLEGSSAGRRNP